MEVVDSIAKLLSCVAKGDPPLNIIWVRDGLPLPSYPRYEVSERESDGRTFPELLMQTAQVQDFGTLISFASLQKASNALDTLTSDFLSFSSSR